jgi:lipid-binding SYLF domain-containing protein
VSKPGLAFWVALAVTGMLATGCSTTPPSDIDKTALQEEVGGAVEQMYAEDPGLQSFISSAYGYAVFPNVGKGALILGGAYGRGQVYESGKFVGYSDISQATIGLQAGGQGFAELIAFQDANALHSFEGGQFTFVANASAVAIKAGAAASAKYDNGVSVFVDPNGGFMFEAAIGGQSFAFQPK